MEFAKGGMACMCQRTSVRFWSANAALAWVAGAPDDSKAASACARSGTHVVGVRLLAMVARVGSVVSGLAGFTDAASSCKAVPPTLLWVWATPADACLYGRGAQAAPTAAWCLVCGVEARTLPRPCMHPRPQVVLLTTLDNLILYGRQLLPSCHQQVHPQVPSRTTRQIPDQALPQRRRTCTPPARVASSRTAALPSARHARHAAAASCVQRCHSIRVPTSSKARADTCRPFHIPCADMQHPFKYHAGGVCTCMPCARPQPTGALREVRLPGPGTHAAHDVAAPGLCRRSRAASPAGRRPIHGPGARSG